MRKYIAICLLSAIVPLTAAASCEKNPDCTDGREGSRPSQSMKPECKEENGPPIFVPGSPAPSKASPGKAE